MNRTRIPAFYFTHAWKGLRAKALRRDGYRCRYCGGIAYQADHVVPRSKGGPDTLSNLVACCSDCNKRVQGRVFASFAEKRAWIRRDRNPKPAGCPKPARRPEKQIRTRP